MKAILFRAILIAIVLVMLFLLVVPLSAQAADPVPQLPVLDLTNLSALLNNLKDVVLLGFVTSPATVLIVSVLKRIHAFDEIASERLAWIVGSLLFAVLLLAMLTGYEVQFRSLLSFVIALLGVLTGPGAAFLGAAGLYTVAKAVNAPIVGFQRSRLKEDLFIDGIVHTVESTPHVKYGLANNKAA